METTSDTVDIGIQVVPLHGNHFRHRWHWYPDRSITWKPLQTQMTLVSRSFHYMETTSDTVDIGIQIVPLHGNHFRHRWHWYPDSAITWKPLQTQLTLVSRSFHYMETTSETDDIGIQIVPLHGNHLRHRWHWYPDRSITWKPLQTQMTLVSRSFHYMETTSDTVDIGIQIVPLHGSHFRHRWHWYPDRSITWKPLQKQMTLVSRSFHYMETTSDTVDIGIQIVPLHGNHFRHRWHWYPDSAITWKPLQTQLTLVSRSLHYMETTSETDDIGIQIVPLHGNHFRHRWHWYPDRSITWKPLQTQMTLVSRSFHYMETTSDTVDIGIQIVPLHGNHFRHRWHWYPDRSITWKPL